MNTSLGERLGAAAVAVLNHDGDALAALSLVGRTTAIGAAGEAKLRRRLSKAAEEVQAAL